MPNRYVDRLTPVTEDAPMDIDIMRSDTENEEEDGEPRLQEGLSERTMMMMDESGDEDTALKVFDSDEEDTSFEGGQAKRRKQSQSSKGRNVVQDDSDQEATTLPISNEEEVVDLAPKMNGKTEEASGKEGLLFKSVHPSRPKRSVRVQKTFMKNGYLVTEWVTETVSDTEGPNESPAPKNAPLEQPVKPASNGTAKNTPPGPSAVQQKGLMSFFGKRV